MNYSLGNGRASWSVKSEMITRIKLHRSVRKGMSNDEVMESVKGYGRKTVLELKEIVKTLSKGVIE